MRCAKRCFPRTNVRVLEESFSAKREQPLDSEDKRRKAREKIFSLREILERRPSLFSTSLGENSSSFPQQPPPKVLPNSPRCDRIVRAKTRGSVCPTRFSPESKHRYPFRRYAIPFSRIPSADSADPFLERLLGGNAIRIARVPCASVFPATPSTELPLESPSRTDVSAGPCGVIP